MRESRTIRRGAAVLSLAAAACTGATGSENTSGPAPEPAGRASMAELEALYRAPQDSARMHFTDADVHFMTGMIGHHGQAIVMSRLAPSHAASASIRTLAWRIINAQQDEIALMQQWLRDRGQPVPEVHIEGTELMVHGPAHAMNAPGMLTAEQLRELDGARGAEFDRLFLTYMIQHHRGAVTMVHELFSHEKQGNEGTTCRSAK